MQHTPETRAPLWTRASGFVTCLLAASVVMPATTRAQARDTMNMAPGKSMQMDMSTDRPLGIAMERMGSGTTWTPDAVTLPSKHLMLGTWNVMVHGFVFGQYDAQSGDRGAKQFGSLNWGMVMVDHALGGGRFQFRFMPSLDAATVGCGYPLLLQSGESCKGKELVDQQHPHDFFMELGALYERAVSSKVGVMLYAAPAGEPALGPVAFMHRPSAMDEPQAPIGHHWQDATHISFGVVTAGIFTRTIRLEASRFNGHEPDEHRWGFDPIALNSYSARLTVNPTMHWSMTAGLGKIDNPDRSVPAVSMTRFTSSVMQGRKLGADGQWATTLIYGQNRPDNGHLSRSVLVESEAVLNARHTVYGRVEFVQKSAAELQVEGVSESLLFNVTAMSLGYVREVTRAKGMTLGLGARGSVNVVPSALQTTYGSRTPVGGMLFVRLRPFHAAVSAGMTMHDGMEMHDNVQRDGREP